MSDTREILEEQEACSREKNELIPRRGSRQYHEEEEDEIQRPPQENITEDRREEKRIVGENKRVVHGNKRKMLMKAKKVLLSPLRRLEKDLERTKEKITAKSTRRCSYRFPYDGEEFGGRRFSHLCFGSSRPVIAASPIHIGTGYSNETPSTSSAAKSKSSSYHNFVKTLIEKNDFFSPDCNVHRDIPSSTSKQVLLHTNYQLFVASSSSSSFP